MDIYWYISRAKLDLLKDQSPGFLNGVAAQLSFKIPFVSGSLAGTAQSGLVKDLLRVIKQLKADYDIKSFADLDDTESPVVVSFLGNAARRISNNIFWLAMQQGDTGLLLAGSAGFAIGAPSKAEHTFSPSADPVGAVEAAFNDTKATSSESSSTHIRSGVSYAWRELISQSLEGTLPRVSGLAIFATTVKSAVRGMAETNINRIVVGTPIYVQQVQR